jgi:site-specific DNA-methyltransferase (adenine-specific)
MFELNKIYCGNSSEVLKQIIPDNTIDLTITSPPYSNLRHYNNSLTDNTWNFSIFKTIGDELFRVTKNGGVVVWIVNDKTENGSKSLVSFKQAIYFQEIGFNINDVMIWEKTNYMPVVKQPRYTDCFEYMFILSKGKPKTFNPIMIPCKCAGQEYHSTTKNIGGENGRTYKEFNINKEKIKPNIWEFAVAQNKTSHPAVFPENLIIDHIKTWSNEGDVVLDPFIGSGTTAIAAKKLKRKYIGIDINPEYCQLTEERLAF